jgi:hypothetical protein
MLEEYVKNVKNMNILYDRKKEIPVKMYLYNSEKIFKRKSF